MNKNKISRFILNKVFVLDNVSKIDVFVSSSNFLKTKTFLKLNQFKFKPYRFVNGFHVFKVDYDDVEILSTQDDVMFIQPNILVQTLSIQEDFINLSALTENKYFGQGQTICFIDTGIFPHFDFIFPYSKLVKFIDFTSNKICPYDDNGHGTFVAGVACGNGTFLKQYSGIASMSKIIVLKALKNNGESSSNTILDAMQWIYENHKAFNISVVCMSFGAIADDKTNPLSSGAEVLWKAGITVVAAAGNSGPNEKTIMSPGNSPYVITVGALDTKTMKVATFSSRGPTIYGHKPDLLAPAVDLVSCNNKGLPYTTMSGTSVATPIVAGVCAVIKSKFPTLTNNEIKNFLLSKCVPITGDKNKEGAGYLKF